MKYILLALISFSLLSAAKDKPALKANPEFFGVYYKADAPTNKEWTLKPVAKSPNKIGFYEKSDTTDLVFYVIMKDSTHFRSAGEFLQQTEGQGNVYWSAKGEFLPGGQMSIAVKKANSSSATQLNISMEAQERVLFIKK